jgi:hypothetical protein
MHEHTVTHNKKLTDFRILRKKIVAQLGAQSSFAGRRVWGGWFFFSFWDRIWAE